jgi:SAM-dependent methyltransferase
MSNASSSVTDSTQRQFGAVAASYTTSSYHATGPDLAALVEAARFRGDERVLDVGTGTGHTAFAVAPHVASVVGLDLTPEMVEQARVLQAQRGIANVTFEVGDGLALPFDDGSFDAVTNRQSLHHYADPARAVAEAARVLKPGGSFLLIDTVAPEDPALDTWLNCVELLRDASHVRDWRASEWLKMLDAAGFRAEVVGRSGIPLDGADWTARMRTPEQKVAMIRTLFREATPAVRTFFEVRDEPWGFTIPGILIRAERV